MIADDAPGILNEPAFIPDIFATEIAAVSEIAGNYRVTFAVARPRIGLLPAERLVVCHLILPLRVIDELGLHPVAVLLGTPHAGEG